MNSFQNKTSLSIVFFRSFRFWLYCFVVFLILSFLAISSFQFRKKAHFCGHLKGCQKQLKQLSLALQLYIDARGKGSRLPPASGGEFWAYLYRTEIILEPDDFLCPAVADVHTGYCARGFENCTDRCSQSQNDNNDNGNDLLKTPIPPQACSYGGRINELGHPYRIFTGKGASDTPIGCDDDEGTPNHLDWVNVVFFDGHCREISITDPILGGTRIGKGILTVCTN